MKGEKWIYPITLVAFLCLRAFAYSYFSGNYTDSDQCVMWQMADDFAHFRFHTPFFYGQLYSSGLEAWLAAPFIWLGIPVYRSVPLVTALMSTLPWIWMSHLARKRSGNLAGSAILCLSLAFPISWLQTTYISRGFMQSVFLTSLATRFIHRSRLWFNIGLLLMGWGLMQNANGLLLLPGVFPIWMAEFSRFAGIKSTPVRQTAVNSIRLIWPATLGLIILVITYATLKSQHPEWMIHATVQTNFSWQVFSESIQRYNWFLQHTYGGRSPLLGCGLIALAVLLVATPTSKNQWLGFLGILLLPLVMLAVEKTTDGTENIFFGYGRFFLAIPFAWGWLVSSSGFSFRGLKRFWEVTIKCPFIFFGQFQIPSKLIKPVYSICLFAAVGLYGYRFWDKCSIRELGKTYVPVMIYPINQLRGDAEKMANLCRTQKIGAVIVLDHYVLETASMGFQQLAQFPFKAGTPKELPGGGFPYDTLSILSIPIEIGPSIFKIHETIPIIRPKYERRHWLLKEIKDHHYIPHKVAVMDVFKDSAWGDRLPFKHTLSDVRGPVFIFETGEMTLSDFLDLILKPSE
ncbi:MAG: hypothetical protein RL525_146 [Bacteroidota bacterium]|jgi:hypothetical protein